MKNSNYICHTPYLRNSIAYDHDSWYICVKRFYLQACFHFFEIFIFGDLRGIKGQKIFQNDKKLSVAHDISGTIHHIIVIHATQV